MWRIQRATDNPFTYRGYYYDKDLDLYRLGTRYYDARMGRFINADDISYLGANGDLNGYNLYAYCSNDPINFCDPTGRWLETVFDLFSLGASVVEVVINPANPWAWAGLIGDAVDLLPFVTGVGESVKATKMVKYADDVIDASHDTIKFAKATDMVDDFADKGKMLSEVGNATKYKKMTKSNHVSGTQLHKLFKGNGEIIDGTRLRVDGLDETTKTIFELKPYNIQSGKKGVKQIINYNKALGGGYKNMVVFY